MVTMWYINLAPVSNLPMGDTLYCLYIKVIPFETFVCAMMSLCRDKNASTLCTQNVDYNGARSSLLWWPFWNQYSINQNDMSILRTAQPKNCEDRGKKKSLLALDKNDLCTLCGSTEINCTTPTSRWLLNLFY